MKMHRFEGATMRDAIAKVKAELGDQAVIISTRQVRKGLLGTAVEISAAIDEDEERDFHALGGPSTGGPARSAYAQAQAQAHAPTQNTAEVDQLRSEMRSLRAMVRSSNHETRATTELRGEVAALKKLLEEQAAQPAPVAAPAPVVTAPKLAAIPSQLAAVQAPAAKVAVPAVPAVPAIPMTKLVAPPVARIAIPAPGAAPAPVLPNLVLPSLPPLAMKKLTPIKPSAAPMLTRPSTGSLVMLVGPTGAGKTTTIAKLAATAALLEGKTVRIVTLDNYRVGGVEQIRQFADLIGVPLVVLDTPHALVELIAEDEEPYDVTFVDTAGTSPRDLSSIHALESVLPALPDLEVHLVIPATSSAVHIDELARRFAPLEPARLLFTKLDEVDAIPELALAPARLGIPLTYVTTGQAVPEDLEQPSTARVEELAAQGLGPIGDYAELTVNSAGHALGNSQVA